MRYATEVGCRPERVRLRAISRACAVGRGRRLSVSLKISSSRPPASSSVATSGVSFAPEALYAESLVSSESMTPRSGGETRTTCAAKFAVRPCFSVARRDAHSLSARPLRCCISATSPPALAIALASLLAEPSRPATVITRRVVEGIWATAGARGSVRLAATMRTKTTRYGSRNGAWRTASWRRAGESPVPSMVSSPKSETRSLHQSASVARARSSTRKRSSPWNSSAVTVPRLVVRGIGRSYLQRQCDGALLVCAQDVGWKAGREATGAARGDELRFVVDRRSSEVGRERATSAKRQQKIRARSAHALRHDRLGIEVEVAEVAERAAVRCNRAKGKVGRAGHVARCTLLRRQDLECETGERNGLSCPHRTDRSAACRLFERGGPPCRTS